MTISLNQYDIYQHLYSSQLNSNGCITQKVNTNSFQIKNIGYEIKRQVEAKIREEGTGLRIKLTWEIKQ